MESSNADLLAEACKNANSAFSTALSGLFKGRLSLEGQSESPESTGWIDDSALILIIGGAEDGCLITINYCDGLTPAWVKAPSENDKRKLKEFGVQCASILKIGNSTRKLLGVANVKNVRSHMEEVEEVEEILCYRYEISNDKQQTNMFVYWPLANAESFVDSNFITADYRGEVTEIPPYGRSLLKVQVPLRVALANAKMPVEKVLEIGQGSIIQFEKRYDQPLLMEVDERPIAVGNAVKVGDKFGFRIGSICKPKERFFAVQGNITSVTIKTDEVDATVKQPK